MTTTSYDGHELKTHPTGLYKEYDWFKKRLMEEAPGCEVVLHVTMWGNQLTVLLRDPVTRKAGAAVIHTEEVSGQGPPINWNRGIDEDSDGHVTLRFWPVYSSYQRCGFKLNQNRNLEDEIVAYLLRAAGAKELDEEQP